MPTTDEAGFLAAICAAPDDDTPRLVYADWLQDRDQGERAEFIRVQVALARFQTRPDGSCPACEAPAAKTHAPDCPRFDLRLREYARLEQSRAWRGPGWDALATAWHQRTGAGDQGLAERRPRATFRRGFIEEVRVEAPEWVRHGGPVAAAHPVRVVRLVGVDACGPGDARGYYWQREDAAGGTPFGHHPGVLPGPLFDLLEGWQRYYPYSADLRWYGTVDLARDALGRSALERGRREALRVTGPSR